MADSAATIRTAQAGVRLVDLIRSRAQRGRAVGRLPELSESDRQLVLTTFITLIEGLYAHLPLKKAMYATDPVQRLRLLAQQSANLDPITFHSRLAGIMTGLRDAHTYYRGPSSLSGDVAVLPFLVESYGASPRYVVSKVSDRDLIGDPHFVAGVELVYWNAVPIDRAVDLYAEHETGGRPDARRARAVASLTKRPLQYGPPPDEHWVDVGYIDTDGIEREVRVDWRVVRPRTNPAVRTAGAGRAYAIDPAAEIAREANKLLFAPDRWYGDTRPARQPARKRRKPAPSGAELGTTLPQQITAKTVATPSGTFGYLRLWNFDVDDDVPYVDEIVRLLGLLPDDGLIIDLRANPGGLIWAAERLLQLFVPWPVTPTRFSLLATALTRAMASAEHNHADLGRWRDSLVDAVATGDLYSQALPITDPDACNNIGQVYGGPVVAVVDPNTYSAGDLFAAGFIDNHLGILVTVGEATGAGGANVWWDDIVVDALLGTPFSVGPLPAGIGYGVSVRRATRVGHAEGQAIEDVGVRGQRTYAMTKADVVSTDPSNADLIAFCGKLLADQPKTKLSIEPPTGGPLQVTTQGLDRLDVYVDSRPEGWLQAADGPTKIDLPAGWTSVEVVGYHNGTLRQRRRLQL